MKKSIQFPMLALVAILGFAVFAAGQTSPKTFDNIKIGNFGQIDEHYYRGAQPEPDDYKSLAALGVKTIIDLRDDPTDYEKADAEAAGLKYLNIPMSGWKSPRDGDIEQFLKVANDSESGTIFVHCKAGIHRTGITAAIYRFTKYGWSYDQAYQEMKNYNFYSGLVHGALKSYVRKYSKKMDRLKFAAAPAANAAGPAETATPVKH
jgi:protein tyrosine/serine phosphatase